MIQIDKSKCTNCMICRSVCTRCVFGFVSGSGVEREVEIRYPENCYACGHCVSICPADAISHDDLSDDGFRELQPIDISSDSMRNLLLSRRSMSKYKPDPVPDDLVEKLLEVAIHAGTSSNGQGEGFIIIRDQKILSELETSVIDILWDAGLKYLGSDGLMAKLFTKKYGEEMMEQYRVYSRMITHRRENNTLKGMIFQNAPLVIAVHSVKSNSLGAANCSLAIRNMEILALTLGLGACWAGKLVVAAGKSSRINEILGLGKDRQIHGALMVGYPQFEYKRMIPRREREVRWL
ncbi:nitroreductase family protein [Candidatus Poribacteria bacterium]